LAYCAGHALVGVTHNPSSDAKSGDRGLESTDESPAPGTLTQWHRIIGGCAPHHQNSEKLPTVEFELWKVTPCSAGSGTA
jgi:hypothetical protein